ncbi:selenoprotein W [Sus scrofa]|uniref:selenoprotein W n=1 Tax=Sus scrofa TaxID=9823 RepID=UPI000A2B5FAE|nr:selenoprotein W [Sus scrofa]
MVSPFESSIVALEATSPSIFKLKKKLEESSLDAWTSVARGLPRSPGFFRSIGSRKLVHSKKGGDGYVDTESKFLKLVAAIKAALAQANVP